MESPTFRISEVEPGIKCLLIVRRNDTNNFNLQRSRVPAKRVTGGPDFAQGHPGEACPVSRVSHQAKGSRMVQAAGAASTQALKPTGAWRTQERPVTHGIERGTTHRAHWPWQAETLS